MSYLITPKDYKPLLDLKQTELGIKQIKEFFQMNLSSELRLRRVTAPLFVLKGMGINDDLNGVERPVSFPIKDLGDAQAEVVHSLAKWKRLTLAEYNIEPGYGIYTDMNAIRAHETRHDLVCRLLLEKKKLSLTTAVSSRRSHWLQTLSTSSTRLRGKSMLDNMVLSFHRYVPE